MCTLIVDNQPSGMGFLSLPDLTASADFPCRTANKSGERAPNERSEVIEWKHCERPGGLEAGNKSAKPPNEPRGGPKGDPVDLNDVDPNLANSRGIIWLPRSDEVEIVRSAIGGGEPPSESERL
jgi:hypothetical protein